MLSRAGRDAVRVQHLQGTHPHSESRRGLAHALDDPFPEGIAGNPQNHDSGDRRHRFFEHLQALHADLVEKQREAGDVAARPRQAGCEPHGDGVPAHGHDRDRLRRGAGGQRAGRARGKDHLHLEIDELFREPGQVVVLAMRPALLDDKVAAFHVSQILQAALERLEQIVGRLGAQEADTHDLAVGPDASIAGCISASTPTARASSGSPAQQIGSHVRYSLRNHVKIEVTRIGIRIMPQPC